MTPWELAKDSEHSQQRAVFAWANWVSRFGFQAAANPTAYTLEDVNLKYPFCGNDRVPDLELLFAIHNQGHGDRIRGGQAKAEGVKSGVPDMMLPVPRNGFAGLFIELKTEDKRPKRAAVGGTSKKQDDWITALRGRYYRVEVAYGWLEAAGVICHYYSASRFAPH